MQELTELQESVHSGTTKGKLQGTIGTRVDNLSALATQITSAAEDLRIVASQVLAYPADSPPANEIDFYTQVSNYEIYLIKRALKYSGGSQVKAAKLMKLKATTLNNKIKTYQIKLR